MSNTVLLTGANGFIGLYVVHALLKNGNKIIAVTRNESRTVEIQKVVEQYPGANVEYEYVSDLFADDAYDDVFKKHEDIKYVLHLATPLSGDPEKMVETAIKATVNLLTSAKNFGKSVARVVYTSSIVSYYDMTGSVPFPDYVDDHSWNPLTVEALKTAPRTAYSVSKTLAEKEFWKFFEVEKPSFDGIALAPSMTLGETLTPVSSFEDLGVSIKFFLGNLKGAFPQNLSCQIVHVKDVAKAFVASLTAKAGGSRWLVTNQSLQVKKVIELAGISTPDASVADDEHVKPQVHNDTFLNQSGIKLISAEEAIRDTLADLKNKKLI